MNKYDVINTATLGRETVTSEDGRKIEIHEITYDGFDYLPGQFVMVQVVSRSFEWAYPYMILCKSDSGFKVPAAAGSSLFGLEPGSPLTVWGANGQGISAAPPVTLVAEASTLFLAAPFFHTGTDCSLIFIGNGRSFVNGLGSGNKTVVSTCKEASRLLEKTSGTVMMALNYANIMEVMGAAGEDLKARTYVFASAPIACGTGACRGCYLHSPDIRSGFPVCCEGPYLPYNRIDFVTDEKCFYYFQQGGITMNLQVRILGPSGGITLKNPVMPAAATYGNIIEYKPYVDLSALGALIPNSIFVDTGTPTKAKKTCKTNQGFLSALSRNNIGIRQFEETVLPALPSDTTPVIINMKAADKFEMEELAAYINTIPEIAGVEINLNCPYGGSGLPYWKRGEGELHDLVKRVRNAAPDKLVIAKAPGGNTDVAEIARICADAGADAFTSFCNMNGMSLDIRTRKFRCGAGGGGGFSGPGLKPMCLGMCYQAAKAVDIPVIGVGGIHTAGDVLEYIMAGAAAVQAGSANLSRPDLMHRILDDLVVLMEELGIHSLEEIRGCASPE